MPQPLHPNTYRYRLHKEKTNNEDIDNYYTKINLIALQNAMHNLTPKAFELWMCMCKNQEIEDNYYLSKVDYVNWSNFKETSYHSAVEELKEKKYLVKKDRTKCKYDFYEIPLEQRDDIINRYSRKNKEDED